MTVKRQMKINFGGNRMTRPNRYPYTKSQWEEEITLVYFGVNTSLKLRAERNRITKETRHVIK